LPNAISESNSLHRGLATLTPLFSLSFSLDLLAYNACVSLLNFLVIQGDYDDLGFFFDEVCNDYHNNPGGKKKHTTNWSLAGVEGLPEDGQLDISKLGLEKELSMRVRVGRNLKTFPLPGAMSRDDRIKFEAQMLTAFKVLVDNEDYGGQVYSLTPHADWKVVTGNKKNPNFISPEKYQELVDAHVMFKVCN